MKNIIEDICRQLKTLEADTDKVYQDELNASIRRSNEYSHLLDIRNSKIRDLKATISELDVKLHDRSAKITELEGLVEAQTRAAAAKAEVIADRDVLILELREAIASRDEALERMNR